MTKLIVLFAVLAIIAFLVMRGLRPRNKKGGSANTYEGGQGNYDGHGNGNGDGGGDGGGGGGD
jgi:hypothetical protein